MSRDEKTITPLYQYFKEKGITPREIAEATHYSYQHVVELLNGTENLSDAARFKFVTHYPETAKLLMPATDKPNGNGDNHDGQEPAE